MSRYAGSLDTSVLLRALLADIPEQHQASRTLIEKPGVQYRVSDTALIELAFVLDRHYGFSRADIAYALASLTSHPKLSCNDVINSAARAFKDQTKLSFEDCYLAEKAHADGALPLHTFDKKLAKQSAYAKELKTDSR
jgi:predicted nucleic-acid-binding protein